MVWGVMHGCWPTVVGISWIFFRATTLQQAINMAGDLGNFMWRGDFGPVLIFIAVLAGIVLA